MSDAIKLVGVSKLYKVFANRGDRLLDAIGLSRFIRPRKGAVREFWSLRDIDLTIEKGSRLGVIGRNGAGKSTLLKLITGNISPTEGTIDVQGQVQALFEAGAGFHPEFTGYENIRAALTYQGLSKDEIELAVADIAEFTELEQFLSQSIKTYSLGMMARLAFATATAVKPDILIVDEVLGAGDAYFSTKSSDRMRRLVEDSGATVLLVSHSLEQVQRYCDQCIWIERGRVIRRGRTMEIANAYESFIHDLEDRRLKGKNRRRLAARSTTDVSDAVERFRVRFEWRGEQGSSCSISEVRLVRDGLTAEQLAVGDVQDADLEHSAAVVLKGGDWTEPRRAEKSLYRALEPSSGAAAVGEVIFRIVGSIEAGDYAAAVRYRHKGRGVLAMKAVLNDEGLVQHAEAPPAPDDWNEWTHPLGRLPLQTQGEAESSVADPQQPATPGLYRWPSEGSLTILDVALTNGEGESRTVFPHGSTLRLSFGVRANRPGLFHLVSGASLFRLDGVFVSNLLCPETPLELTAGEVRRLTVEMSPLNLGDGYYVFALSIFEKEITEQARYDLIARCIEFRVVGNEQNVASALFQHPSSWTVAGPSSSS